MFNICEQFNNLAIQLITFFCECKLLFISYISSNLCETKNVCKDNENGAIHLKNQMSQKKRNLTLVVYMNSTKVGRLLSKTVYKKNKKIGTRKYYK